MLAERLVEVLTEALADELLDTDSDSEVLSLTEVDKLAEVSESLVDVSPRTTVFLVAKISFDSTVFSTATVSLAYTLI